MVTLQMLFRLFDKLKVLSCVPVGLTGGVEHALGVLMNKSVVTVRRIWACWSVFNAKWDTLRELGLMSWWAVAGSVIVGGFLCCCVDCVRASR